MVSLRQRNFHSRHTRQPGNHTHGNGWMGKLVHQNQMRVGPTQSDRKQIYSKVKTLLRKALFKATVGTQQKPLKTMKKNLYYIVIGTALAFGGVHQSLAAPRTWDGSDSTNFNLAANWDALPVSGQDSLIFSGTSPSGTTLNNDLAAGFALYDMQFSNTALAYTISGNAVTMNGNIVLTGGTNQQIINLDMNLTGTRTMQANGANIRLGGNLTGVGGIRKTSAGTLYLTGTNTYAGNTLITAGTIAVNSISTNLGSGTIQIGSTTTQGTLAVVSAPGSSTSKTIDLAGTTGGANIVNSITSGTLTLAGNFTASGAGSKTLTLTGGSASALGAVSGSIVDNSTVNKTSVTINNGIWTLSGNNTYTGNSTVSTGTLVLADNSRTAFEIGASGVNNQIAGGGTLTLNGDFVFNLTGAGTTLGDSWNIVNVGTLSETFGTTFSVVDFYSVSSTLWAQAIGGGKFYNFDETTGLLSVTTVPEPAAWALLAGGLTFVVAMRRRRRH